MIAVVFAAAVNVVVAGFIWRRYRQDAAQDTAEKMRAGLLVGEPCAYCGQIGEPVESDWRTMERRYVCQDARRCVARGRVPQ